MRKTYSEIAENRRKSGGRAPRFNVGYFTRREVREALENNKYFSHACIELGLLDKDSKSQFNGLKNMHKLISHFRLSTSLLGKHLKEDSMIECPHCGKKFEKSLEV